jgi:hypothetical protein
MNSERIFISVLLFLMPFSHANPQSYADAFRLPEKQIEAIQKEALAGDKDAAFKLYQHHLLAEEDRLEGTFWLTLAAYSGNDMAQYNLAMLYLEKSDSPRNQQAAIRWLKLAAPTLPKADEKLKALK